MSGRRVISVPSYRLHKQSGQAIVTLVDAATGKRSDILLGKHGSSASRAEYASVIAEWEAASRCLAAAGPTPHDLTINELMLSYFTFVAQHYRRPDGTPTNEQNEIKYALRPLKKLYGHAMATEFGPLALKSCRQVMIDSGLARTVITKRVSRIRRMFKWAVENELVAPSGLQGLQAVAGLQCGRTDARETDPVRPVAEAHVEKTLAFAPPTVAALARLQMLTAARSGELVTMRSGDINTASRVWVYTPRQHKTAHRGRAREIYLGPKAQEIIRPWLKTDIEAFVFSPIESETARNTEKRNGRKIPLWPSHVRYKTKIKRRAKRTRVPKDRYTSESYARAIARACDRAFAPPEPLARRPDESESTWLRRMTPAQLVEAAARRKANRWHSHQLRHAAATKLRREFGIETARVVLGHSSAIVTEIYAGADRHEAQRAIALVG